MTRAQIIEAINEYMQAYDGGRWYVGITANPRNRLFNDHGVDEHNGAWIFRQASSAAAAREVEMAYVEAGHAGGPGGGDDTAVFVYAYLITNETRQ